MLKSELREIYLNRRKSLSDDEVKELSYQIFQNFISEFSLKEGQSLHCFLPIQKFKEIDTFLFINHFWEIGVNVFVPKVVGNSLLSIPFTSSTLLEKNKWDILEPKENGEDICQFDMVLTPLLYCDEKGNRIGYGKGFYDAFFEKINADCLKVGLSYFPPLESIDDVFSTDVPVDYLVSPSGILSFFGKRS